ncbi:hypothetical protein BCR35DRAFT_342407 [Leucosporidium creatinivorum]|uniref:F-box domain-containing protein n=1 Tax=Leucosporidium creatinivorum TaxID=106004 RepID=A0A1Y2F2C4_9BASI|nr:hypothetical protein BCR35DRAFT_342407 [Leucosporidium creatinivorum]
MLSSLVAPAGLETPSISLPQRRSLIALPYLRGEVDPPAAQSSSNLTFRPFFCTPAEQAKRNGDSSGPAGERVEESRRQLLRRREVDHTPESSDPSQVDGCRVNSSRSTPPSYHHSAKLHRSRTPPSRVRHLAASEARAMAPVGDESSPSVPSLPTETLAHIASFLAPTLLHHWLPGARGKQYKQWKDQHKIITSLQIADRRFAAVCRPLVWRTVCFSAEDELHAGPAALMVFSDKQLVKEVRWETDSERLTDMSSQFLPLLTNLDSLGILYVNEQGYRGSNRFPRSLASTIVSLKVLRHLQLQDIRGFIGGSLDFGADLPRLESLGTGSWWHHGSASSTPGQLKRAHYILDFDIYDFDEQEAFFDVYLPRLHHLSLECYFPPSGRLDYHRLPSEASDGLLQSYDAETRQAWPLESLELSHMDLVESWEVHGLLETLGDSSKLHTLSFHDCPTSGGTSMQPWRFLTMPHIRSLKVHIGKPPVRSMYFLDKQPLTRYFADCRSPRFPSNASFSPSPDYSTLTSPTSFALKIHLSTPTLPRYPSPPPPSSSSLSPAPKPPSNALPFATRFTTRSTASDDWMKESLMCTATALTLSSGTSGEGSGEHGSGSNGSVSLENVLGKDYVTSRVNIVRVSSWSALGRR